MLPGANHVALGWQPGPGNTGVLVQKGCSGPLPRPHFSPGLASSSGPGLYFLVFFPLFSSFKIIFIWGMF